MLAINIIFAGFVLTLNGFSLIEKAKIDQKVKGAINLTVGVLIAVNAILQTIIAGGMVDSPYQMMHFGFAAAMWLFSVNYLILGFHVFLKAESYKAFGLFSAFASIVSFIFAVEAVIAGGWLFIVLWFMWAVLWLQSFLTMTLEIKWAGKLSAAILIINGVISTFLPGMLMVLGVL
ncbi:MAG: AmiS/UreI family transporter [Firmicutes bacterium]|nr:AmiS/UreI family transporter [Bacillota bacterium]